MRGVVRSHKMADDTPKYFATKKYKLWIKRKLEERKWSWERFAAEVTKRGQKATGQNLHKLFGGEDDEIAGGNTTLMPAINKTFGLPQPTHFDPTTPLSRLHAALDANWDRVPEDTQKAWALLIAGSDPAEK